MWCVDLRKRGANPRLSATTAGNGPWCLARSNALELALPDVYFACLGIPRLAVSESLDPPNRRTPLWRNGLRHNPNPDIALSQMIGRVPIAVRLPAWSGLRIGRSTIVLLWGELI